MSHTNPILPHRLSNFTEGCRGRVLMDEHACEPLPEALQLLLGN